MVILMSAHCEQPQDFRPWGYTAVDRGPRLPEGQFTSPACSQQGRESEKSSQSLNLRVLAAPENGFV